jgi:hypothetical protein
MQKIDFTQVKLVPVSSLVRHYGVELRKSGSYLIAKKCPLPTHTSEEVDTFKISIEGNWWTCFSKSCRAALGKKGGDVIDFVKLKEDLNALDAAKKISDLFCLSGQVQKTDKANLSQSDELTGVPLNKPLTWTLQGINPEHPVIQARGISIETARTWGVGFYRSKQGTASMDNRIVFPLHEDGNLVGYAGRAVDEGEPKWKLGKGIRKSFLYGLERCDPAKPVIVAESFWAPLWFSERGDQCAALMGTDITEEQERRLDPFTTVVVALDNDEKGKEASAKITERLRKHHTVIRAFLKE